MLTCVLRALLIVKLETPMSYLPLSTPAMIVSKPAGWYTTLTPSFCATALNRSTSMPSTVLPSAFRNSLGAYVASVPTTILPADLTLAGSLAARAASTLWDAAGVLPEVVGVDRELEPQALRARPTIAAPAVNVTTGRRRRAIRGIPSTEAGLA